MTDSEGREVKRPVKQLFGLRYFIVSANGDLQTANKPGELYFAHIPVPVGQSSVRQVLLEHQIELEPGTKIQIELFRGLDNTSIEEKIERKEGADITMRLVV